MADEDDPKATELPTDGSSSDWTPADAKAAERAKQAADHAALIAAQNAAMAQMSAMESRDRARSADEAAANVLREKDAKSLMGCGIPAIIAGIVVTIAVAGAFAFLAGDDDEKCTTPTPKALGGTRIELIADCDEEPTTTSASGAGPGAATPVQAALPAGQVLYQGTSGGELGCITCDGQSRFISIEDSTTASGDAARAGQEIVWPEDGGVVDLGVRFSRPNRGRHGINLFVNGAYSAGCAMETGGSSCRVAAGQDPSVLKAGDRVTIIVGEAGTLDEDGVPVEQGDFVLEWWFVFQPD